MSTHSTTNGTASHETQRTSSAATVVRLILAALLCALAWLCVRNSLMIERLARVFHQLFTDTLPDNLSGFVWQHPRILLAFAVIVAVAGLAFLAFSRVQRRAVIAAALAAVILLAQWLVITPSVYHATVRTIQGASEKVSK
jgi:cytochrome bd-type quinol oxidase subunit 2